ncbi:hypothetical protein [Streptomyces sp. WAC01280]|uniref:hypothetical protein n=1 Tax=Streptomyces sp. WAC01280 TaxID=2487424 RepID=UPI000F78AD3C|nr:hypothetical protein [Streptomyces sp. WAC01280]RSS51373.1 hypothetical protein EF909_34330 [Streptomyces sp. WAC01280]
MSDEPQTEDPMIAALLRERDGLEQRGLTDRVKQVDEQLKFRGYKKPARGAKEQATPAPAADETPKGRQQQAPATT